MRSRTAWLLVVPGVALSISVATRFPADPIVPAVFAQATPAPSPTAQNQTFSARLSGAEEVPPVNTQASGTAEVQVDRAGQRISFRLNVSGITGQVAAHIHLGAPGQSGPIILPFTNEPFGDSLQGELESADLQPAPDQGINTMADAIAAIEAGNTYVNVHTQTNPQGEIRGQLLPGPAASPSPSATVTTLPTATGTPVVTSTPIITSTPIVTGTPFPTGTPGFPDDNGGRGGRGGGGGGGGGSGPG